ncbi:hypothetical protein V8C86DRAFT_1146980 [Haematococcus lacustris]
MEWSNAVQDAIMRRDAMPGGEKWCSLYVRYHATDTAAHAVEWDAAASRQNLQRNGRPAAVPTNVSSLSMALREAPAEWCAPVKQDRRLSPTFKVAVDVRYRGAVAVPVTVKAFLLTQQQKDNILLWSHEGSNPDDKTTDKKITELKGSTSITHIFTSPGQPSTACSPPAPSRPHRHQGTPQEKRHSGCGIKRPASQLDMLYSAQASGSPNGCFASSLRAGWGVDGMEETAAGGVRAVVVDVGKQPQQDSAWGTLGPCPMLTGLPLPSAPPLDLGLSPHPLQPSQGQRETQQLLDALSGVVKHLNTPTPLITNLVIGCESSELLLSSLPLTLPPLDPLNQQLFMVAAPTSLVTPTSTLPSSHHHQQQQQQQQLDAHVLTQLSGSLTIAGGATSTLLPTPTIVPDPTAESAAACTAPHQHLGLPAADDPAPLSTQGILGTVQAVAACTAGAGLSTRASEGLGGDGGGAEGETMVMSHEFDFANLELMKPTRMNKVYLVFCATILDVDYLYLVYNVPTIGICRAEQREKAALKLGLSLHCLPSTNHHPNHQSYSTQPTSPQGLASIGEVKSPYPRLLFTSPGPTRPPARLASGFVNSPGPGKGPRPGQREGTDLSQVYLKAWAGPLRQGQQGAEDGRHAVGPQGGTHEQAQCSLGKPPGLDSIARTLGEAMPLMIPGSSGRTPKRASAGLPMPSQASLSQLSSQERDTLAPSAPPPTQGSWTGHGVTSTTGHTTPDTLRHSQIHALGSGLHGQGMGSIAAHGHGHASIRDVSMREEGLHEVEGPVQGTYSRELIRSWILDQYESTGLTRRLSDLDVQVGA